jgi:hypothetical protein
MSDDGLLITSTSSNKRSLTEHFVDYVKKTKCLVPCSILSPSKKPLPSSSKRGKSNSIHQFANYLQFVPGSLCIAYSISNDNSLLTLHGKYKFVRLIN